MTLDLDTIYLGDCLEVMKDIPDGSVDMILCDLPYGCTQNKWDIIIPIEPLWELYKHVIKQNGAILLFGSEPFSSAIRLSNANNYKYDWVWVKTNKTGFYNAKKAPLRKHELISVFYQSPPIYNPQMYYVPCDNIGHKRGNSGNLPTSKQSNWGKASLKTAYSYQYIETGWRYPDDVLIFPNWNGGSTSNASKHPTQKPVALLEYLIRTYTNEGDMVLDNCMGSGSTCIAAINTNRHYIGIEKEQRFFDIAQERIRQTKGQLTLSSISPEVTG